MYNNETIVDLQIFPATCWRRLQIIGFILSHLVKHAHVSQFVYKGQEPDVHVQSTKRSKSSDSYIFKTLT